MRLHAKMKTRGSGAPAISGFNLGPLALSPQDITSTNGSSAIEPYYDIVTTLFNVRLGPERQLRSHRTVSHTHTKARFTYSWLQHDEMCWGLLFQSMSMLKKT